MALALTCKSYLLILAPNPEPKTSFINCFLEFQFASGSYSIFPLIKMVKIGHRLNMELDLQSLFDLHAHSCTHWLRRPHNQTPSLQHLGSYTRALSVSQDRQHLFLTPEIGELYCFSTESGAMTVYQNKNDLFEL